MKPSEAEQSEYPGRPACVVRMFAGYASSPLWTAGGPRDLRTLGVTADLRADLLAWEAAQYGGDGLLTGALPSETAVLARRMADEFGEGIEIRVGSTGDFEVFRSHAPPSNPAAAARLVEEHAEEQRRRGDGRAGGFVAYAPLSGTVYFGGSNRDGHQF